MNRKDFLSVLLSSPLMLGAMKLNALESITSNFSNSPKMPALFIGHGHPMNAILDNEFTRKLTEIGQSIPTPNAIMVVSAHWETKGTFVSTNPSPKTIYDFGGFDQRLFEMSYTPNGHPEYAQEVAGLGKDFNIQHSHTMGLDHGAWTVLHYMYPKQDIPVFQLSLDHTQGPSYHFQLATALKKIREKGVLVIGSGNIVHNLGKVAWKNIDAEPFDWSVAFDKQVKDHLLNKQFNALVNYQNMGMLAKMSIPTADHYLPLIYTLGLADSNEHVEMLYEGIQYGSISMRCFKVS